MTQIIASDALLATLGPLTGPVELCDSSGAIVAYVTPARSPSMYDGIDVGASDEELTRSEQAGGRSLKEIFADWDSGLFPPRA